MLKLLLRMKILDRLAFFKRNEMSEYIAPTTDALLFMLQIVFIATGYLIVENGLGVLMNSPVELVKMFLNSIYFVFTTITTVGYGDISPTNFLSKLFVIIFLFLFLQLRLVKILTNLAAAKIQINEFKRIGRLFKVKENTIIVQCDVATIKQDNFLFLRRFIKENRISTKFKHHPILIVNSNEDEAQTLNEAMIANHNFGENISHSNITINEEGYFDKIGIEKAAHVYVLGNQVDSDSDSKAFDFVYRVEKETDYTKGVTCEIVHDKNRKRCKELGANIIMRPNRSYPEMLVTATIAEGTAEVLEELSRRGDDTMEVFTIEKSDFLWGNLLYRLSMDNIGTAVAVIYDTHVDLNPMGYDVIKNPRKIIVMIHEMKDKSYEEMQQKVSKCIEETETTEKK